jgi:DNA-binding transcriptional regulator YhcF (GntR family)
MAAVWSFLKDTRGAISWSTQELAKSLTISAAEVRRVAEVLELQGYIKQHGTDQWITTISGETVSGSKTPRFTLERVENALASLSKRIKEISEGSQAQFTISKAVAFGDFLNGRARVQAPDVGIQLVRREPATAAAGAAQERSAEREFLKSLRGNTSILNIQLYQKWMSDRPHRRLL